MDFNLAFHVAKRVLGALVTILGFISACMAANDPALKAIPDLERRLFHRFCAFGAVLAGSNMLGRWLLE